MHHSRVCRLLALLLAVCVLPAVAFADTNDGTPVTRSAFTARLRVNPDGFPEDTQAHVKDWQVYLDKLALTGVADAQSFLSPFSRVYFDGGLYLNGQNALPLVYDGYYSFRYLRSPALGDTSMHFQMFNFLQFMLKGYYFMELPTQLIGLLLYPEATTALMNAYEAPLAQTFAGEGTRTVSYDELLELCERLNALVQEDPHDAIYYYLTCLLTALDAGDITYERLGAMELWLDYLDPEQQGMAIEQDGDTTTYTLGDTTLLTATAEGFTLHLPEEEGAALDVTFQNADGLLSADVQVTQDEDELIALSLCVDGLPTDDAWQLAEGTATFSLSGSALMEEHTPVTLRYRAERSAALRPYDLAFDVDVLHAETGLPTVGATVTAHVETLPPDVLVERPYDNQDDFFHLNEGYLEEYKEQLTPTIARSLLPFVLEMPGGAFADVIDTLSEIGILSFLGLE